MKRRTRFTLLFFAAAAGFFGFMNLLRDSGGTPVENNGGEEADRYHAGHTPPERYILEQLDADSFDTGARQFLSAGYDSIREVATARGGKNEAVRKSFRTLFGGRSFVYLQGCTIGNVRDEIEELRTVRGQLAVCGSRNENAGYYLYRIDERKTYRLDDVTGFIFFTFIAATVPGKGIYSIMRPVNPGQGLFRTVSDSLTCPPSGDMYVCSAEGVIDGAIQIPAYYGLDIMWPQGWVYPWYE